MKKNILHLFLYILFLSAAFRSSFYFGENVYGNGAQVSICCMQHEYVFVVLYVPTKEI